MAFRIHKGIFQSKNASNVYENKFKIDDESGALIAVDAQGAQTGAFLRTTDVATDSNLLDGLDSSSFLRSDADDSTSGYFKINKSWGGGDYGAEAFTIRGTYPSITLRSSNANFKWLLHTDASGNFRWYTGSSYDDNAWTNRFTFTTGNHFYVEAGNVYANGGNSTQWNTAYGWGNHASAGYLSTSYLSASNAQLLTNSLGVTTLPYRCDIVIYGESNMYYPVQLMWGDQDVWRRIIIKRAYWEQAPADWYIATHPGGLLLDWEGNFGGWGGATYSDRLRTFNESYSSICASMYRTSHSMGYTFFLRGGGTTGAIYHIFSDQTIRGYQNSSAPDIAYDTEYLFYDHSNEAYKVYAPAPMSAVDSARIASLRTLKRSELDLIYQPVGSYAAASHTHDDRYYTESEVDTLLDGKQDSGSYAASSHSHAISDVTGLQTALDNKQASGSYAAASHNQGAATITSGTFQAGRYSFPYQSGITGSTAPNYSNSNVEIYTDSNHVPTIGFHRGGVSATALYEYDGQLYVKPWTTRAQIGLLLSSGNIGSYAWTSGNDGAASGLDADLLDGLHASSFLRSDNGVVRISTVTSGVSLSVGNGTTHGVYTSDDARNALVVGGSYYPHVFIVASGSNNTNHGAVLSFVGTEGSSPRQWNMGTSNQNPFLFSIGYNSNADTNPHYGLGDNWNSNDANHARLLIDRSGNVKIRGSLYVNGTKGAIDTGSKVATESWVSSNYQAAGSYAAASHSHAISDVTGLQTALDGKQASGSYAAASHTHDQIINNTDGGTFLVSNSTEYNNWLFQENARGWGIFYFNKGSEKGQTFGDYTTVGAETFFIGQGTGTSMPAWTGRNASSKVAVMISNYNGTIWSAGNIQAEGNLKGAAVYDNGTRVSVSGHTHDDRYYTETEVDTLLAAKQGTGNYSTFQDDVYLNESTDTDSLLNELYNQFNAFRNNYVTLKCAWSYAGNSNLDTGTHGVIELAGCIVECWGNTNAKHVRITRPTTGAGGSVDMLVYNSQYTGYSPGWTRIWNDRNDGAGSGLDADTLDGQQATAFAAASHTHDDRYYTETEVNTLLAGYASTDTATASKNGLMSSTDKSKLDGVAANANNYSLPFTDNSTNWNTAYNWGNHASAGYAASSHTHGIGSITDASRWWNNFGANHSTRTSFDAAGGALSTGFGWRYVQGSGNSPGWGNTGNGQYYALTVGLGNDYDYNLYGMQMAIPRNSTTPYLSVRFEENRVLGAWQKISAGYADSAGAVAWGNVSGKPSTFSPSAHTHDDRYYTESEVDTLLAGKQAAGTYLTSLPSHDHSSISGSAGAVSIRGYGTDSLSFQQTSGSFAGYTGWANHFIGNHGSGATYYNTVHTMPFWGTPRYSRLEGGSQTESFAYWTEENFDPASKASLNGSLATDFYANKMYSDNWFRAKGACGLYFEDYGYGLWSAYSGGATYGNVSTYATGRNGWSGYSVGNWISLMAIESRRGLFLTTEDRWLIKWDTSEAFSDYEIQMGSDARNKSNVQTLTGSLDKVKALRGVSYNYKNQEKTSLGFIAQEVKQVIPEVVSADSEGYYAIGYQSLIAVLSEAIKEQQTIIDALTARVEALENNR